MQTVDVLIIGATFCGAGIACSSKKKVMIVEAGFVSGSEFAAGMNQKTPKTTACRTEMGKKLEKMLRSKKLLNKTGELYAQPAVFVLSALLCEQKTDVRLNTLITDIQKTSDGCRVTLLNEDGQTEILAKQIIDTTSTGVFCQFSRPKYLCTAVDKNGLVKNEITGMHYSVLPLDASSGWAEAREQVLCEAEKCGQKIIMSANNFVYRDEVLPKQTEYGLWMPSDGFYNLLAAFEGGADYAEQNL